MEFEWDEAKRLENVRKHKLDFVSAVRVFSGNHLRAPARDGRGGEPRWLAVGVVGGVYVTAVYTMRGDVIRMISFRRARDGERRHHQEVFG